MVTVTFQQGLNGYQSASDTYLRESRPDKSYETKDRIYADGIDKANGEMQGLLHFGDLFGNGPGQIPDDAIITSATLTLDVGNGTSDPFTLNRMVQSWTDGTPLTWNAFGNGIQADGSEALAAPDVSLAGISKGMQPLDVTQSLQAWAQGGDNFGWLISVGGGNGMRFASTESASAPVLSVTYELPTIPQPGLLLSQNSAEVTEDGATDDIAISLKTAPTSDVTFSVTTDGPDDVTRTPTSFTFTSQNWQTPQTLTLGAIDDDLFEGTEQFTVSLTTASADPDYNNLSSDISLSVLDNDLPPPPPGFLLSQDSVVVTEDGATEDVTISLRTAPTADVTFSVTTDGSDDVTGVPTSVTFTSQNWQTPQTLTLGAIDDDLVEGAELFTVSFTTTSADPDYNNLSSDVSIAVLDNDGVQVPLSPAVVAIHDTTQYSAGDPSGFGSGDPSGIAYVPGLDVLFIADSEHNESPYFSTVNLFATTLDGTFIQSYSMLSFTDEPTGLAYNPHNGYLYISDDDAEKLFYVDPADPTVLIGEIDLDPYGIRDAEDPVIDPVSGHIYMLSGRDREIIELSDTGEFLNSVVLPEEIKDAEGFAFDPMADVFYLASGSNRGEIFQLDRGGAIIESFDLLNDFRHPETGSKPKLKGLEWAPSSDPNDGDKMNLYAVDYGRDQVPDGRVFEIDLYHDLLIV